MMKKAAILLMLLALCLSCPGFADGDFRELLAESGLPEEDVCAFLEIPGSDFLQPVMQHGEDAAYYLDHGASGAENASGALYTEHTYNARDFSDPVTVIYGRRMSDGSMFGSLQEWYSGSFSDHQVILLHLPDGIYEYTVFAAVPHSGEHLLYYNNFQYARVFSAFFDGVLGMRRIGVQTDEEQFPEPGDRVIILSTTLRGDSSQRYLVMAKLSNDGSN